MTYVDVNGLPTWHEVRGDGQPVVLLHGAFAGASSWAAQTPVLARAGYRAHVPERRGHAHTGDVEGPLSYGVMADDTATYLDGVVGGPAHLVGWSDGTVVALLVGAGGDQVMGFLRAEYDLVSPDGPEHFPVVYTKTMRMLATEPELDFPDAAP